ALVDTSAPVHTRRRRQFIRFIHTHHHHHPSPRSSQSISFCDDSQGWVSMMASALAVVQSAAALAPCGGRNLSGNLPQLQSPRLSGRIRSRSVVVKAAQDSSESSGSIVKYVKSSFSTAEDIFGLAGIGFATVAALWASVNLIEIIDKLPVLPLFFELIGILVAWLFIYNNLLFKSKRQEFLGNIKSTISRISGQ
ncbi:unnamed protein product, partial [Urochloa humidicola]